jgi:hypothetical protein
VRTSQVAALLVWCGLCVMVSSGEDARTLYAYPGLTPVINGVLEPGEWDDALQFRVPNARVYVKHDGTTLYFAFDVTDDAAVRLKMNALNSWELKCDALRGLMGAGKSVQRWIDMGAQKAAVKRKPGGKGYVIEWAIRFDPCLETAPGKFHTPAMGDWPVGFDIAIHESRTGGTLWMKAQPLSQQQPMKILRD